jgi:DNA modification methylase
MKLLQGDALELIKSIPDESIDLVILDPNYQDWEKFCKQNLIEESLRTLKNSGNILCFTKQPFDLYLRNYVNNNFKREIIWSFTNGGAWVSKKLPLVSFQKIYWLTKSNENFINVRTGLNYKPNTKQFKRKNKVFENYNQEGKEFELSNEGTWIRDHYHFNKPHTGNIPSKPSELIKILIHCFSPTDGTVLDPFLGSGISAHVASNLNRNFIGFELDIYKYNLIRDNLSL